MHASIIVPTRNRRESLRGCLEALTALDYDDYEVIVVDDGSSDESGTMVRSSFPNVSCLQPGRVGQVVARNCGIQASRGELLVFTDDDCIAPPNWLRLHSSHYADARVGIVGGPLVPVRPNFLDRFYVAQYRDEFVSSRRIERIDGWERLRTGNLSMKRSVVDRVGTFDERFLSGSDADQLRRVVRAGYAAVSDPALGVAHHKTYTLRTFLRERFRKASGSLVTDVKEGTLAWRRFLPLPNPRTTQHDWRGYHEIFGGGLSACLRFWALATLTRWADVAGRAYFYWKLAR